MFNNITTNKNKTEIAPTYTIRIKMAKNSIPKKIVKQELKKKIKTKANIECTGLFVNKVYNPTSSSKQKKIKKKKSILANNRPSSQLTKLTVYFLPVLLVKFTKNKKKKKNCKNNNSNEKVSIEKIVSTSKKPKPSKIVKE